MRYINNNHGFSFVEAILAAFISSVLIYGAMNFFNVFNQATFYKEAAIQEKSQYNASVLIRSIIKEGHVLENGTIISGATANSTTFKFKTSFFSNDIEAQDWYTMSCKKNGSTYSLYGKRNSESETEILKNLQSCSFTYYDSSNDETTTKITAVKINADYYPFNNKALVADSKKQLTIFSSMIHST